MLTNAGLPCATSLIVLSLMSRGINTHPPTVQHRYQLLSCHITCSLVLVHSELHNAKIS